MFGKKTLTAEELEKLFAELPDEEKEKFNKAHKTTEEEIEEAEENIAEKGEDSQTEEDRVDESVAAQEKAEGEEDTQTAKDRVDEAEGEEERAEDDEHHEESKEADEATHARLAAIEETLANLTERLDKMLESIEDNDFGHKPAAPMDGYDGETESPIMRAYYAKVARR